MSDLLSSASLLIAIVAVLYGHWYPDITRGKNLKVPDYAESAAVPLADVHSIILRRALPLTLTSVGLAIVFFKDAIKILYISLTSFNSLLDRLVNYDAVNTAFVFVEILLVCVSFQLLADLKKLRDKRKEIKSKPSINAT